MFSRQQKLYRTTSNVWEQKAKMRREKHENTKQKMSPNLSLDIEGRVESPEGHVVKFAEGHSSGVQFTGLLVFVITQLHLEFTALANVAVFTIEGAVPAQFLGAVRVGSALYRGVVEPDLAENRSREADWGRSVRFHLAYFDSEVFHPFSWSAGPVVNRFRLVL